LFVIEKYKRRMVFDEHIFSLSCLGSSHSDKEMDNTPEKVPRSTERKRKRKADDGGFGGGSKGSRSDSKKINEYFPKHPSNSPIRHGGAKSPSPQQGYVNVMVSADLNSGESKIK
jgi:hypothetical protein